MERKPIKAGRCVDAFVGKLLLPVICYFFFLRAVKSIPLACIFAFCAAVFLRKLFAGTQIRFRKSRFAKRRAKRAQAEKMPAKWSKMSEDAAKEEILSLVRLAYPDFAETPPETALFLRHPTGTPLSPDDVLAARRAVLTESRSKTAGNRPDRPVSRQESKSAADRLLLLTTGRADPRARALAQTLGRPKVAILEGSQLTALYAKYGPEADCTEEGDADFTSRTENKKDCRQAADDRSENAENHPEKIEKHPGNIEKCPGKHMKPHRKRDFSWLFRRKNTSRRILCGSALVFMWHLTGSLLNLLAGLVILFFTLMSLKRPTEPKKLFG